MRYRLLGAVFAVLLLGACATVPPSQSDENVVQLIDRFNTTAAEDFVAGVRVPFLFGQQVLYTESDVIAVLARLQEAGLVIAPVIVGSSDAIAAPEDARFDVNVFYDRLPDDARLIITETNAGDVTLIVGGEADGLPQLLALERGRR